MKECDILIEEASNLDKMSKCRIYEREENRIKKKVKKKQRERKKKVMISPVHDCSIFKSLSIFCVTYIQGDSKARPIVRPIVRHIVNLSFSFFFRICAEVPVPSTCM